MQIRINMYQTFLILMIFLSNLEIVPNSSMQYIGVAIIVSLSVVSFLVIMSYLAKNQAFPKFFLPVILCSAAFLIVNLLGIFQKHDSRFFITLYQFIFLVSLFLLTSYIKWDRSSLNSLTKLIFIFVLFNVLLFYMDGMHKQFQGLFENSNTLGMLLYYFLFFVLMYIINNKGIFRFFGVVISLISIILIYYSDTRSVFLGLFFVGITYMFWGALTKSKKIFSFYFWIIASSVVSFIYIYPRLVYWNGFYSLNTLVIQYTGKNLYSGREEIWLALSNAIGDKLWLGYGAGTLPNDIFKTPLSSHNLYIQIMLQTGILGMFALLMVVYQIWKLNWNGRDNKTVRLSASFLIGLLIQQSFEVAFTQNNVSIAILQWLILAIGVSVSYQTYKQKILENH